MNRTIALAKVSRSGHGYKFVGSSSDDRIDLKNTRLDLAIYKDFIQQSAVHGMPVLNIAHYSDGVVGQCDQMWVDGHYFKIAGGFFEGQPLADAAIQTLLEDRKLPTRRVQQSVGFYPRLVGYEDDVLVYLRGWIEHSALTVIPVNPRTDIHIVLQGVVMTKVEDAAAIVGMNLAQSLEEVEQSQRRIRMAERVLFIPRMALGEKSEAIVQLLCGQIAAPEPILVFCEQPCIAPRPDVPTTLQIDPDVEKWLAQVEGEVDLGVEPLLTLSRSLIQRQLVTEAELSDNDVIELMAQRPSYAYLSRLVDILKSVVGEEVWNEAHKIARGHAGGTRGASLPTSVVADVFQVQPAARLHDVAPKGKLPQLVRAFLSIYDANAKSSIPEAEKITNVLQALDDLRGRFLDQLRGTPEAQQFYQLLEGAIEQLSLIDLSKVSDNELLDIHEQLHRQAVLQSLARRV